MRPWFLFCLLLPLCPLYAQKEVIKGSQAKSAVDSLLVAYRSTQSDTARLSVLTRLVDTFEAASDFENVLRYNDLKLKLAQRMKTSGDSLRVWAGRQGECSYLETMGVFSKKQGNSRQALNYFLQALGMCEAMRNEQYMAKLFSQIASTHSQIGNYNEALLFSFKALKQKEKLSSPDQTATELNNIGAIYSDTRQFSKALYYFTQARDISRMHGDDAATALYTGNIGHAYQLLCDSAFEAGNDSLSEALQEKALGYYFSALGVSEKKGDLENASVCLENIGIIYANVNQYQQALPYLLRALDIYRTLGLKAEQSYCLVMLGECYKGTGEYPRAQRAYTDALVLAGQTHSNYYLMEASLGNSEFYEKIGKPALALKYYKDYIIHRDSIFSSEKTRALAHTQLSYEFSKKEAALKFENDKVVYKLESDRKLHRQWRLFFIVASGLGLIILFFGKRAYDNKKKLATILADEDRRKDALLQEVHHRINNNLQIISSLLTLQDDHADNQILSEYLSESQARIQSLSAMHELLYDTSSPLEINMQHYLHKVLGFHRDVARSLPIPVTLREEVTPVSFPTKLAVPVALIVNELVTNSLKYAFAGMEQGIVWVVLAENPSGLGWKLTVSDNGKGLPSDGTSRKASLGLRLVQIMVRQLKGKYLEENGRGASFSVIFDFVR